VKLAGRTALVTGAARRLGRATALRLAARGASVAVHYGRSEAEAEAVAAEIRAAGGTALTVAADLADPGAVVGLAEAVTAALGPVDVLVNNASRYVRTPLAGLDEREWDAHLDVNLKAPYLLAITLGRAMVARGAGKIVNIADVAARRPFLHYLPYSVSKAGLVALTRGLARELAPAVQVNCVAPGPVVPPEDLPEDARARILARTPLGRFGSPDDVAGAVLWLVEEGDFVTGSVLTVDGGRDLA
jgi:NAD(P)-dependent dehydrogenase (short-subunit alcohol dehydrogenase family)